MLRTLVLAGVSLAALAVDGSALAADIPGDRTTRAKLPFGAEPVIGVWEKDGDRDWYRVKLAQNLTYAFGLDAHTGSFRLFLHSPTGKVLKGSNYGLGADTDAGVEFTAKTEGIYFVEVVARTGEERNVAYQVTANIDCAGRPRTDCLLKVGKTAHRLLSWGGDVDWFRARLDVGQSYTFTLLEGPEEPEITLLDADGKALASAVLIGSSAAIAHFVPRRSGTHYLQVRNRGEQIGGFYTVRLTQP